MTPDLPDVKVTVDLKYRGPAWAAYHAASEAETAAYQALLAARAKTLALRQAAYAEIGLPKVHDHLCELEAQQRER